LGEYGGQVVEIPQREKAYLFIVLILDYFVWKLHLPKKRGKNPLII